MSRLREIVTKDVLLSLYYALVYPYLVYCVTLWGSAKQCLITKLLLLQKRAVRLCSGATYRAPSTQLFVNLRVLRITDICNLYVAIFMYNIKTKQRPESIGKHVLLSNADRTCNIRITSFFRIKRFRTTIGEGCIAVRGPRVWDSIPTDIQNSPGIGSFKRQLINHYMSQY